MIRTCCPASAGTRPAPRGGRPYARLERGKISGTSREVFGAVARALRLDEDERRHLFGLVRITQRRPPKKGSARTTVRPGIQKVLDSIETPALVQNRRRPPTTGSSSRSWERSRPGARSSARRGPLTTRSGTKLLTHPDVADLEFGYESFELSADPGLVMITVGPDSPTAEAVRNS